GAEQQREPRRRGEDVVRRLTHVDVIVRVDTRIDAARLAEQFRRAVGEHFVGVHVVRRAGAGLIHVDDELIAEASVENLVGGRDNRARHIGVQAAERGGGFGRGFLDQDGRGDEVVWRTQAADRKVLDGARRLDAVVRVGRNLQLAQRVALGAVFHGGWWLVAAAWRIDPVFPATSHCPQPVYCPYVALFLRQRAPTHRTNLDRPASGRARRDENPARCGAGRE